MDGGVGNSAPRGPTVGFQPPASPHTIKTRISCTYRWLLPWKLAFMPFPFVSLMVSFRNSLQTPAGPVANSVAAHARGEVCEGSGLG